MEKLKVLIKKSSAIGNLITDIRKDTIVYQVNTSLPRFH